MVCTNPSSAATVNVWFGSTLSSNGTISSGSESVTCWKYLLLANMPGSSWMNNGAQVLSCPSLKCHENRAWASIIVSRPSVNALQCGPIIVMPCQLYLHLLGLTLLYSYEWTLFARILCNVVIHTEKVVVGPYLLWFPVSQHQPLVHFHLPYPLQVCSILDVDHQLKMVDYQSNKEEKNIYTFRKSPT